METVQWLTENYQLALGTMSDPRSSHYFLMSSPVYTYGCCLLYLIIVWLGPKFMANREPYKLTSVMKLYNFTMVLASLYMFYEFFATTVLNPEFSLVCQPMDYSDNPLSIRLSKVCWLFFFSKLVEFADTLFFILRKKNNQVTFLHVYHHVTMPLLWWIGVRFIPGGESYFSAMINSFVHILMYAYYGLAAFGPGMQKYLWWKKYITSIQLIQFWSIVFKSGYVIQHPECFPRPYAYALLAYCVSHILLFSNFYIQSYMKAGKVRKESVTQNGHSKGEPQANGKKEN